MSGDITRSTFHPHKHFSGVRWQQGRVPLDADQNEQVDIQKHLDRTEATDVIGRAAAPRDPSGGNFDLSATPDGKDLWIAPGRIYVEGILCELEGQDVAADAQYSGGKANQIQVASIYPDGEPIAANDWVEVFVPGGASSLYFVKAVDSTNRVLTFQNGDNVRGTFTGSGTRLRRAVTYLTQPDLLSPSALPTTAGTYLAYLDVWERDVSAVDDPSLLEVALGGADTATRRRVVWQVKLSSQASGVTCSTAQLPGPASTGLLAAKIADTPQSTDPCIVSPSSGYRSLENQLYRVQVFQGGAPGVAQYVWSRDNGAFATSVKQSALTDNTRLPIGQLSKANQLRFQSGGWVELIDDAHELAGRSGTLVKFTVDGSTLVLDQSTAVYFDASGNQKTGLGWSQLADEVKVRLWDSSGMAAVPTDATQWVELENGVLVRFAGGTYATGDWWEIPARTITGTVDWPLDGTDPRALPGRGIRHHYANLGLVTWSGTQITGVTDCRALFPPLSDIHAGDVKYDPIVCDYGGAKTVQDVLNKLCNAECCCTSISPADDAQKAIDDAVAQAQKLGLGGIHICFSAGKFNLAATLVVQNVSVVVEGAGPATVLVAPESAERAITFSGCPDAVVRNLSAQAKAVAAGQGKKGRPDSNAPGDVNRHLNGVIAFVDCDRMDVERVSVQCGWAVARGASCISVRSSAGHNTASARVRSCRLSVGYHQVGLLLLNVQRSTVEDNEIAVYSPLHRIPIKIFAQDPAFRGRLRSSMLSQVRVAGVDQTKAPPTAQDYSIAVGQTTMQIRVANKATADAWNALVNSPVGASLVAPVSALPSTSALQAHPLVAPQPKAKRVFVKPPAHGAPAAPEAPAAPKAPTAPAAAEHGAPGAPAAGAPAAPPAPAGAATPAAATPTAPKVSLVAVHAAKQVRKNLELAADQIIGHLTGVPPTKSGATVVSPAQASLFQEWLSYVEGSFRITASHGICVAGTTAADVRIADNTISGCVDAIHVGLSHGDPGRKTPADIAGRVVIRGNSVDFVASIDAMTEPKGIFVGSFYSVTIEDNLVKATRFRDQRTIDGIRVFGTFGDFMAVQRNHLTGVDVGVRAFAHPHSAAAMNAVRAIDTNSAVSVPTPVSKNF